MTYVSRTSKVSFSSSTPENALDESVLPIFSVKQVQCYRSVANWYSIVVFSRAALSTK